MNAQRTRPARPTVSPPDAFEALDRTHVEVMQVLGLLARLLDHVDDNGPDDVARRLAAEVRGFFERRARQHHADEDEQVFPALLASGDDELVHHVKRLQQDHGWLEEDWLALAPHLAAIEQGYNGYDLPLLRHALPVFSALYREHIALEEGVVYPAARRHREALACDAAARLTAAMPLSS